MLKDFSQFTESTQLIAKAAYKLALQSRHFTIEEPHLFWGIFENPDDELKQLFTSLSLNIEKVKIETSAVLRRQRKVAFWRGRKYQFYTTETLKHAIEDAIAIAEKFGEKEVRPVHLFWGVVNASLKKCDTQSEMSHMLIENDITAEKVLDAIKNT